MATVVATDWAVMGNTVAIDGLPWGDKLRLCVTNNISRFFLKHHH